MRDLYYTSEVGCRDETMPKTIEGTVRRIESMQQSSATPKNQEVGRWLQKIVACSQPPTSHMVGTLKSLSH